MLTIAIIVGMVVFVAGVAQLVEHELPKLEVVGSTPIARSKEPLSHQGPFFRALIWFVVGIALGMKLYINPMSSNARRATMAAIALDVPVELVMVDMRQGEHRQPSFLAINPIGKVPALVDGDLCLSESWAIMLYLASVSPHATLYPTEPKARARVHQWMFWAANHFHPRVSVLDFENMIKGWMNMGPPDADIVEKAGVEVDRLAGQLNAQLEKTAFACGATMTIADYALSTVLQTIDMAKLPVKHHPALMAWFDKMRATPAWQQTEPKMR
jgi:glutathione S-transferase